MIKNWYSNGHFQPFLMYADVDWSLAPLVLFETSRNCMISEVHWDRLLGVGRLVRFQLSGLLQLVQEY